MAMPRGPRARVLVGLAVLGAAGYAVVSLSLVAFACGARALAPQPPSQGLRQPPTSRPGAAAPVAGLAAMESPEHPRGSSRSAAALAVGAAGSLGALVAAVRGALSSQHRRVAARVARGAPSLIQVLEQKKLLSFAESQKLLSKAESAGLGIQTVEELGLLKLAEDLSLLSLAEGLLTNPTTPLLLLGGAGALGGLAYLDATAPDFGFLQWVLVGALGAPAVVLFGAAVVVFGLAAGTRRTKDIERQDKVLEYSTTQGFKQRSITESATLLETAEKKGLLSFLEENRLLSLAASLVNRPLTLTENLGILSTLESTGLLSTVEAQAAEQYGALKVALPGLLLVPAALLALVFVPGTPGVVLATLAALVALVFIAIGIAIGIVQAPTRFAR